MKGCELVDKLARFFGETGHAGKEIKIQLHSGDIVTIKRVQFVAINGGEFHIIAGPTEDEEDVDIESEHLPPHLRSS